MRLYTISFDVWHEVNSNEVTNSPNRNRAERTEERTKRGTCVGVARRSGEPAHALLKFIKSIIFCREGSMTTIKKIKRLTNFNYGLQKQKKKV